MKRSIIFWNFMIIVLELLLGLAFFGNSFGEYCAVLFGLLHSLFLIGEFEDSCSRNKDRFEPYFLLISPLGVIILIVGLVIFFIIKFEESRYNPIKPIRKWITKFNKWLDREK